MQSNKGWILLVLLVFSQVLTAQHILIDNYPHGVLRIHEDVRVLKDTTRNLMLDDLLREGEALPFKSINGNYFSDGFTDAAYWLRFSVHNKESVERELYFEVEYPMLNFVDFYAVHNGALARTVHTGELRNFITRDVPTRNFVFRLTLPPKTACTYYLRVYNSGETVRIPFFIGDQWAFYRKSVLEFGVGAFFFGLLFFAFIFNLLLFFSIRERLYLLFSLYVFVLTLFMFSVDGLAFQFLWPNSPQWQNKSTIVLIYLVHLFLLSFADNFIQYKRYIPVFHKVNIATGSIVLLLLAGTLLPYPNYRYIAIVANLFTLILLFVVILGSVCAVVKGRRTANLFIISFVILLSGALTYVLRNMGLMPDHFLSQYGLKIGLSFQVVFLCFTVFERFKVALTERREQLESMVKERTEQIEEQKTEIEAQRDSLMEQHEYIQTQNKDITDSIRYAERIQRALLPSEFELTNYFQDSFIYYAPRNIVSGDFYWVREVNDKLILIASDCTGHGVPGGFMSVLGIAYLNEVVNECDPKQLHASAMLEKLTNKVVASLHYASRESQVRDSMDMTVCIIDRKEMTLEFAGANNPIYVITGNSLEVHRGSKKTVGMNHLTAISFADKAVQLQPGDMLYCFSDGYLDQLGGSQNKTYGSPRFRELLLKIHRKPCTTQQQIVNEEILDWKRDNEQTDDMLVMGVRI